MYYSNDLIDEATQTFKILIEMIEEANKRGESLLISDEYDERGVKKCITVMN